MRFTQLGAAVAVAAVGANSFLIPPPIDTGITVTVSSLVSEDAFAGDMRVVAISCPGCPVAVPDKEGKMHQAMGPESLLRLNFTVAHDEPGDYLLLNGVEIFGRPNFKPFPEPLVAPQLIKSPFDAWVLASSQTLGYKLLTRRPERFGQDDKLFLVELHLQIQQVGDNLVDGIPSVLVRLLQTPSAKMMIAIVQIGPTMHISPASTEGDENCTTMICKWRAIVADKLSKFKGCGKKSRPMDHESNVGHPSHRRPRPHEPHGPHGHPPHPHHRHHNKHHGFTRFLRRIVLHVVIPITIGIVAGVTASLFGMIVGHLVIFLWRTFFRRDRSVEYVKVEQEDMAVDDCTHESKTFIQYRGPPPVYEDVVVEEKPALVQTEN